jgi:hypothetical protein
MVEQSRDYKGRYLDFSKQQPIEIKKEYSRQEGYNNKNEPEFMEEIVADTLIEWVEDLKHWWNQG